MSKIGSYVSVSYDSLGDVLYLATDTCLKARVREEEHGLLVRSAADGRAVGVTVEDFEYRWCARKAELIGLTASILQVDEESMRTQVAKHCP